MGVRLLVTCLLVLATACSDPATDRGGQAGPPAGSASAPTPNPVPLPRVMAALGDSITRAFILCEGFGDCPEASWSTGTAAEVDSHRQRITRAGGGDVAAHNLAVSGARVSGLAQQVASAVALRPDYVTVLIGANDACRQSEGAMTPVATFASTFDRALTALTRGLPRARILVVSVPDLLRLWEVGKDRAEVRDTWTAFSICQSMLAEPTDTSPAAASRRTRVRNRVVAYNTAMAASCAKHARCRWDGNAVFDYDFDVTMLSDRDRWHPSRRGQRTLSDVAWRAGFWPGIGG